MRKCIRCGTEMKENCYHMLGGHGTSIIIKQSSDKLFDVSFGEPSVAVCPSCGEVSWYLNDVSKLKR